MTSVTLTGSGGGTYAYSAGPTNITAPGTYTVTVTSANGCTATATTTVAQDITTPTAGLTNDGPLTCLMTSVTLTGSGGGTYAYSAGPTGITTPGTYTVTVTSANGCTATATTTVAQDITTPTAGLTNDGPLTCLMTSVTLTGSGGGTYAYSAGTNWHYSTRYLYGNGDKCQRLYGNSYHRSYPRYYYPNSRLNQRWTIDMFDDQRDANG
jgi:outer membrane lipoprotein-sorting protein